MKAVERVLIVVLALVCLMLAWQNRQLKSIINRMQAKPPVLEQGEVVPPIVFTGPDGTLDSLTYDASGVSCCVAAILKPTCPVCRKTLPIWEEIKATLPQGATMTAVSTTGGVELDSLVREEAFTLPVGVIRYPERFAKAYKVHGVPLTVVASRGGRVEGVWLGLPDAGQREEIADAISQCASCGR